MNTIPKSWYKTSFGRSYPKQYRWQEKLTKDQANFVRRHASSGPFLLDAACGYGRHALNLGHNYEYIVTGIDLSADQIKKAVKDTPTNNSALFLQRDIRDTGFDDGKFQTVINLFSSFGYFDDKGNLKALKELVRVLERHGVLILDLTNPHSLPPGGRVRNNRYEDPRAVNPFSFRVYTKDELQKLAKKVGLRALRFYGGYKDEPYRENSPRLILVAKKR